MPSHTEETNLVNTDSKVWTRNDIILLAVGTLLKFGDAAEVYLPGVITQDVSCDFGVSRFQEGVLGIVLFLFLALATLIAVPISKRFGERCTLLISLHGIILFTLIGSAVPNYYTLLVSRALIGLFVGLNSVTIGVYIRKNISSTDKLTLSMFLHGSVTFPLGAAWVSIMGYLILHLVGWRIMLFLVTVPVFIPPVLMLHFNLADTTGVDSAHNGWRNDNVVENFPVRVIKLSLFQGISKAAGFGIILLQPSLIRKFNMRFSAHHDQGCSAMVKGTQFLVMAAVTGGASLMGRPVCYFLRKVCKFTWLQSVVAAGIALSYGLILINPGIVAESILLWLAMFGFSIQETETWLLMLEPGYYGRQMDLGAAVTLTSAHVGGAIGVTLTGLLNPHLAVAIIVGACSFQALLACTMADGTEE